MTTSAPTTSAQLTRKHSGSVARLVHEKPIALRLEKHELEEAHEKAKAEGRSSSNFARMVYLMGMAEYRRKGRIELTAADLLSK